MAKDVQYSPVNENENDNVKVPDQHQQHQQTVNIKFFVYFLLSMFFGIFLGYLTSEIEDDENCFNYNITKKFRYGNLSLMEEEKLDDIYLHSNPKIVREYELELDMLTEEIEKEKKNFIEKSKAAKHISELSLEDLSSDPCAMLRKVFLEINYHHKPSDKEVILGAGQSHTGQRWVADFLQSSGYTVGHLGKLPIGDDMHTERDSNLTAIEEAYANVHRTLMDLEPVHRESFNYDIFSNLDGLSGILNMPTAEFFPYFFRAYPNAKIILTVRNATMWYDSIINPVPNDAELNPRPTYPTYYLQSSASLAIQNGKQNNFQHDVPEAFESMLQMELQNTFVRCIVPSSQLLEINLFTENPTDIKKKITEFLQDTPKTYTPKTEKPFFRVVEP